ncbi:MAG: hypothetical protein VKJ24_03130 [Synechococcales bacterium]|nr:hypothetical protein [Synechococcales bacterium]
MKNQQVTLGTVVGLVVAVGLSQGTSHWVKGWVGNQMERQALTSNPFPSDSPMHKPFEQHMGAVIKMPAWEARFKDVSGEQASQIGGNLSRQGMRRLDNALLERRMVIMTQLLNKMDDRACAQVVKGASVLQSHSEKNDLINHIAQLDEAAINDWWQMTAEAVKSELQNTPAPKLDSEQVTLGLRTLVQKLPPQEGDRFVTILEALDPAKPKVQTFSDREVCWVGRTLYKEAQTLVPAQKQAIARALVNE